MRFGKKLLALLLAAILCMSLVTSAFATNEKGVTFTANLSTSQLTKSDKDQSVTVTVTANKKIAYNGIDLEANIPDGLELTAISVSGLVFGKADINLSAGAANTSTEDLSNVECAAGSAFITLTYKIPANAEAKTYTLGVKSAEITEDPATVWESGATATATLTIKPVVTDVTVTAAGGKNTLAGGETLQLTATPVPAGAETTFKWTSSNNNLATVDKNGLVTANSSKREGKVTITATSANGKSGAIELTITNCLHASADRTYVPTVAATCMADGVNEHWLCKCGTKFTSQTATTPATDAELKIDRLEHVWGATTPEEPATCTKTGTKAYKVCTRTCCNGKKFDVNTGKEITNLVIPVLGHDLKKVAGTPATCTTDGTKEYWECDRCHEKFLDSKGQTLATAENTKIPAPGHKMVKTEAKAATCTAPGNKEYYTCSVCKKLFTDEAGTTETTIKDVTLGVLAHKVSNGYVVGDKQHWKFCPDCGAVVNVENHNYDTNGVCICGATTKDAKVDENHKNHNTTDANRGWSADANKHWKLCGERGCYGHVSEGNHNFKDAGLTVTENGKNYKVVKCDDCGYVTRVEVKNNTTGTTTGTNPNAKNPYEKNDTTKKDNGKTVKSGKTFDAGIALYVGLSVLSVTGGALVIGKKKEF